MLEHRENGEYVYWDPSGDVGQSVAYISQESSGRRWGWGYIYFRVISQQMVLSHRNESDYSQARDLRPELWEPLMFQGCGEENDPIKETEGDQPLRQEEKCSERKMRKIVHERGNVNCVKYC